MYSAQFTFFFGLATLAGFFMNAPIAFAGGGGVTSLEGTKTAGAAITRTTSYDWTIQKTTAPSQTPFVIRPGMSIMANFTLAVVRGEPVVTVVGQPVKGKVCITNTGFAETVELTITDVLQIATGNNYQDIATQLLPVHYQLAPGETDCYPYQFNVNLDPSKSYRNIAIAEIRNYAGHDGFWWGITIETPVKFITTEIEVDGAATINDTFQCPTGFTCEPLTSSETLSSSKTIAYQVRIQNDSAACGQTFTATNDAQLVQNTSQQVKTTSAGIRIHTGTCRPAGS